MKIWASHNNDNSTKSEEVGTTIIQDNIIVLVKKTIYVEGLLNLRMYIILNFPRFY